jgi:hypothetical protein
MTKLASPVLVTEKLPGVLPAATVSTASEGDVGATVGRVGCCGLQAITPPRGGGGASPAHVHPPNISAYASENSSSKDHRDFITTPLSSAGRSAEVNTSRTVSGASLTSHPP